LPNQRFYLLLFSFSTCFAPKTRLARNDARQAQLVAEAAQNEAVEQRDAAEVALGRQLAARAELLQIEQPNAVPESILLALESLKRDTAPESILALHQGLPLLNSSVIQITHEAPVKAVAFRADGKQLVTWSGDWIGEKESAGKVMGQTQVWDISSGQVVLTSTQEYGVTRDYYKHNEDVRKKAFDIFFSPDGRWLVAGGDVIEVSSGQVDKYYTTRPLAFSPDSQWVITWWGDWLITESTDADGNRVVEATGFELYIENLATKERTPLKLDGKPIVKDATISSNQQWLVTVADYDNLIQVWNLNTGQEVSQIMSEGNVNALTFSPDSKWLVTANDVGIIQVWDVATGRQLVRLVHEDAINAIAFNPTGNTLATADNNGTVRLWDVGTWEEITRLGQLGPVNDIAFSPDGQWLVTASDDGMAQVWDVSPREEVVQQIDVNIKAPSGLVRLSPDGKWLAAPSDTSTPFVKEVVTNEEINLGREAIIPLYFNVIFSPDSQLLAGTGMSQESFLLQLIPGLVPDRNIKPINDDLDISGEVQVWSMVTQEVVARLPHDSLVFAMLFSPDRRWLATTEIDDSVHIWDANTFQEVTEFTYPKAPSVAAFRAEGQHLVTTGSEDNLITWAIWDTNSGEKLEEFTHEGGNGNIFSTDGDWLATATEEGDIWVLDVATGSEVAQINHLEENVYPIAFSADRLWLATVSDNGIVRVWDLSNEQQNTTRTLTKEVVSLLPEGTLISLDFSHDDRWLTIVSRDDDAKAEDLVKIRRIRWQPEDLQNEACDRLGRNMTYQEWQQYFGIQKPYEITCPNLPLHPSVLEAGRELAKQADLDRAKALFERALELDPDLDLDPEIETNRFAAQGAVARGEKLASRGDFEGSLAEFQNAKRWDADIINDPEMTARELTVKSLIDTGTYLAKSGDIEEAISKFQAALELDVTLVLEPETEARQLAAKEWIERAERLLIVPAGVIGKEAYLDSQIEEAFKTYKQAIAFEPPSEVIEQALASLTDAIEKVAKSDNATFNNQHCWFGSIEGFAEIVMPTCERAVELELENGKFWDSRGLARALTGDYKGAIEDFKFAVEWFKENELYEKYGSKREAWIAELEAGQNPFDEVTLKELLEETLRETEATLEELFK
jgi:WD40 repeat protein